MIASVVFFVVGVGALFYDRFRGFVRADSDALPFLNPDLWPWWIIGLTRLMAAKTALMVAVYRNTRWSPTLAVINTILALGFAIPATALLAWGQLVNPDVVTLVLTDNGVTADTLRTLSINTGASIIGIAVWDIIDGWHKVIRDNRR